MKKFLTICIVFMISLFAINVMAFTPPQPVGFITDSSGQLSKRELWSLNDKLKKINETTSNEIAVLVVPSIGDSNIEDATHDTFKAWRVGKAGLDNGVLLMVALKEHKMRIETGKGVEGDLPDLKANDILNNMKPYLRSNNLNGAINLAADQIGAQLESRKGQKPDPGVAPGATFNAHSDPSKPMDAPVRPNVSCDVNGIGLFAGAPIFAIVLALLGMMLVRRYRKRQENAQEMGVVISLVEKQKKQFEEISELTNQIKSGMPPKTPLAYEVYHKREADHKPRKTNHTSHSNSNSYSWGGGSSGGFDGGGFGGGDSGGGGSSSDW